MRARSGASLASAGQTPNGRGSLLRSLFGNLAPVEQRSRLGRPGPTPFMGAFFAGAGFNPASAGPSERSSDSSSSAPSRQAADLNPWKPRFPGFPSDSATGHPWQGTPRFCASAGGCGVEKPFLLLAEGVHGVEAGGAASRQVADRKSTRLNSSHLGISYAGF